MVFMRRCRSSPVHALPRAELRRPHVDTPGGETWDACADSPFTPDLRRPALACLLLYLSGTLPHGRAVSRSAPGHGGRPDMNIDAVADGTPAQA